MYVSIMSPMGEESRLSFFGTLQTKRPEAGKRSHLAELSVAVEPVVGAVGVVVVLLAADAGVEVALGTLVTTAVAVSLVLADVTVTAAEASVVVVWEDAAVSVGFLF
uniref:Uncharacterized protein n=1 Tax=Romanomermis culicivorax TaxID=13658 RepID=A0A915IA02_ROMCU